MKDNYIFAIAGVLLTLTYLISKDFNDMQVAMFAFIYGKLCSIEEVKNG